MEVLLLSSGIIFVYSLFWLILSDRTKFNLGKPTKRISDVKPEKPEDNDSDKDSDKESNDLDNSKSYIIDEKPEPFVIDEIPWISPIEYAKYDFLDYSVRELSYPEEKIRYYAVVTMTGGEFNKNKVNAIIQFNGTDKSNIYGYGLIPPAFLERPAILTMQKRHIWSFDEVKRRLNAYIKDNLNGLGNTANENWKAYYNSYGYFFDTVEEATFALCAFKQIVDEKLRKRSLSIHNISENVINVKFEE